MKILFYTLACFIFSFTCVAQEKVPFPNFTLELPKGVKKVTRDQAITHITNKLNDTKLLKSNVNSGIQTNLYLYNDVLISLNSNSTTNSKKHNVDLSKMKQGFDELSRGLQNYHSEIKKSTNTSTLVIRYSIGNTLVNRFYSYNEDFTEATTGTLEYDKANESNGRSAIDMIVKTLKFSN